jgi:hypothetical protein
MTDEHFRKFTNGATGNNAQFFSVNNFKNDIKAAKNVYYKYDTNKSLKKFEMSSFNIQKVPIFVHLQRNIHLVALSLSTRYQSQQHWV